MSRWLSVLTGFALLLGGGLVHGLWTDRWTPQPRLARAGELLAGLPADLDGWKGQDYEKDSEELASELALTGAVGHYIRLFVDPVTGDKVLVMLLAGKPVHMAVHRPEDCYRAAGYELAGQPVKAKVEAKGAPPAEFFTGLFSREESEGPSRMRIYWSWLGEGEWEAPKSPRFRFARQPVLYKLYVIRSVGGVDVPVKDDPCIRLLGSLLPVLHQTLNGV